MNKICKIIKISCLTLILMLTVFVVFINADKIMNNKMPGSFSYTNGIYVYQLNVLTLYYNSDLTPLKKFEKTITLEHPNFADSKISGTYIYLADSESNIYNYYISENILNVSYMTEVYAYKQSADEIELKFMCTVNGYAYFLIRYYNITDVVKYNINTDEWIFAKAGDKTTAEYFEYLNNIYEIYTNFMHKETYITPESISPDGKWMLYHHAKYDSFYDYEFYILNLETGESTLLLEESYPHGAISSHEEYFQWFSDGSLRITPVGNMYKKHYFYDYVYSDSDMKWKKSCFSYENQVLYGQAEDFTEYTPFIYSMYPNIYGELNITKRLGTLAVTIKSPEMDEYLTEQSLKIGFAQTGVRYIDPVYVEDTSKLDVKRFVNRYYISNKEKITTLNDNFYGYSSTNLEYSGHFTKDDGFNFETYMFTRITDIRHEYIYMCVIDETTVLMLNFTPEFYCVKLKDEKTTYNNVVKNITAEAEYFETPRIESVRRETLRYYQSLQSVWLLEENYHEYSEADAPEITAELIAAELFGDILQNYEIIYEKITPERWEYDDIEDEWKLHSFYEISAEEKSTGKVYNYTGIWIQPIHGTETEIISDNILPQVTEINGEKSWVIYAQGYDYESTHPKEPIYVNQDFYIELNRTSDGSFRITDKYGGLLYTSDFAITENGFSFSLYQWSIFMIIFNEDIIWNCVTENYGEPFEDSDQRLKYLNEMITVCINGEPIVLSAMKRMQGNGHVDFQIVFEKSVSFDTLQSISITLGNPEY